MYEFLALKLEYAIVKMAKNEDNLHNFGSYLTHNFPEWLKEYADTPTGLVDEFVKFAEMTFD